MKSNLHNIITRGLVSVLSLAVFFGITGVATHHHILASSYKLIKIITNKDKLWFQDPSKRGYHTMGYADHNKGVHVRKVGSFYRHHHLYYEVVPNGYGAQFPAFILASSTNAAPRAHSHYRARKAHYKFGYWKRGRYHTYKTGYFLNGKWHRKITFSKSKSRRTRRIKKHNKHSVRRVRRRIVKKNRHKKVTSHRENNSLRRDLAEAKTQTLKDINADRKAHGRVPVKESSEMDKIGAMRAKQDENCAGHYDPSTNQPYELEDADRLGINFGKGAETDSNGVTHSYVFTENLAANYGNNGKQVADNANDDMMYHDQDQGNGHRKNILYKPWRYVGIGTAPAKGEYSGDIVIAEEFADWVGNNPNTNNDDDSSNNSNDDSSSNDNDDSYAVNNNNNNGSSSTSYSNGFSNNNNNNSNGGSTVAVASGGVGGSATGGTVYSYR